MDILCWKPHPSGKCTSKTAYRVCLQDMQQQRAPSPRGVPQEIKQILKQVWKEKNMVPRIQTFAWRLLRRAIPTGMRAGKYSSHVSKNCPRCGGKEDDMHLFFTCPFAKAAWFSEPWYIRTEQLALNHTTIPAIIISLLNSNHPQASLINVMTYLWCIWKARNDVLFSRKTNTPLQVYQVMQAILKNQELALDTRNIDPQILPKQSSRNQRLHKQTNEDTGIQHITRNGCRVFTDAAWTPAPDNTTVGATTTGIGIFVQLEEQQHQGNISIAATGVHVTSPLQAEALALLAAAQIATKVVTTGEITFFTDNQVLAKAADSRDLQNKPGHWEIRNYLAAFIITGHSQVQVIHIPRNFNSRAHRCATQVYHLNSNTRSKLSCCNPEHLGDHCPTLAKLGNIMIQQCKITNVTCAGNQ